MKLFNLEINRIKKEKEIELAKQADGIPQEQDRKSHIVSVNPWINPYFRNQNAIITGLRIYRTVPSVFFTVSTIASIAMATDWFITPNFEGANPENKKKLELFFQYPNADEPFESIIFNTVARLKLTGEAFWEIIRDTEKQFQSFYYCYGQINPEMEGGKVLKYRQLESNQDFDLDEMIYFKMPNPEMFRGQSELEAIDLLTGTELYNLKNNIENFKNRSITGDAIYIPSVSSVDEAIRNKEEIYSRFQGRNRQPIVMEKGRDKENGIEIDRAPQIALEADFLGLFKTDTELIQKYLGYLDTQGRESEFANIEMYQLKVKPILKIIENRINVFNYYYMGISDWSFKFKPYSPSLKAVSRLVQVLGRIGAINGNEARELSGLDRLDDVASLNEYIRTDIKPAEQIGNPNNNPAQIVNIPSNTQVPQKMEEKLYDDSKVYEKIKAIEDKFDAYMTAQEIKSEMVNNNNKDDEAKLAKEAHLKKLNYHWRGTPEIADKYNLRFKDIFVGLKTKVNNKIKSKIGELAEFNEDDVDEILDMIDDGILKYKLAELSKESNLLGRNNSAEEMNVTAGFEKLPDFVFSKIKDNALKVSQETIFKMKNGAETGEAYLKQILSDGVKSGDYSTMRDDINKLFNEWETWKTDRIVRTEMEKAYNSGRIEEMKAEGVTEFEIILGNNPCEECLADAEETWTTENINEWQDRRHPNDMCVPVAIQPEK